jgi:transposase InsO family protein
VGEPMRCCTNSDQGSQYTSDRLKRLLGELGIT